jgi:hypothetical protein
MSFNKLKNLLNLTFNKFAHVYEIKGFPTSLKTIIEFISLSFLRILYSQYI